MLWLKLTSCTRFRRKPIFFRRKDKILYTLEINSNSEQFGYAMAEIKMMYAISPKADIFSPKRQSPLQTLND